MIHYYFCIRVFTFMHTIIYVIVLSAWLWYMTCVTSTLHYLYVISLVLCSFAYASAFILWSKWALLFVLMLAFILWSKWALLFVLMLNSYLRVHCVGLGHISLPNSFVLIDKSLYEPSPSKKTSLFHILEVVLSSITKKGEIKSI